MMTEIFAHSAIVVRLAIAASAAILASGGCARPQPQAEPLQVEMYTAGDPEFHVNATLIHGRNEALLVDTQFGDEAVKKLVASVAATKLKLKAIFITHPDEDHFGGMAAFKAAFPDTPVYMTARGLAEFQRTADPADHLPSPQALPQSQMAVDGQQVVFIEDLQGDYAAAPANTPVWIPSSRTVIADDLIFRGVHLWLTDSTPQTRAAWRRGLQRLAALHPDRLIPGHQAGHDANSPSDDLIFTDSYIAAFDETAKTAPNPAAFVSEMERRFPGLRNRELLEYGAKSVYAKRSRTPD